MWSTYRRQFEAAADCIGVTNLEKITVSNSIDGVELLQTLLLSRPMELDEAIINALEFEAAKMPS